VPFQNHYEGLAPEAAIGRYALTVDGETVSGSRIKYLSRTDLLAKEYLAEIGDLKAALNACRHRIDALHHALAHDVRPGGPTISHTVEELTKIKAQLSAAALTAPGPQPLTQEFTYEGRGQTASVIPQDPANATREHGAAIMRIAPRPDNGFASLQLRFLINCYASEANSVTIAVFQDGKDHPVALSAEPLPPKAATVIDKAVVVAVENSAAPPAFDIHIGVVRARGVLFLNHAPGETDATLVASRIRVRWLAE
jgi:hypothetical protein